jgi:hypothetical protein
MGKTRLDKRFLRVLYTQICKYIATAFFNVTAHGALLPALNVRGLKGGANPVEWPLISHDMPNIA